MITSESDRIKDGTGKLFEALPLFKHENFVFSFKTRLQKL